MTTKDALSDETMMKLDWNYLGVLTYSMAYDFLVRGCHVLGKGEKMSKEIFSSDFAMQRLVCMATWDLDRMMDKKVDEPLTGAADAAFKHYCSCYPGGKPTYNLKLAKQDEKLFKKGGFEMTAGPYSHSVCQVCYNHSRYLELWGSAECTNHIPFQLSEKLLKRHHPDMDMKPCILPWLCEPGKMRGKGFLAI
ncbi:unnamed protein product [Effrenium voratum]|uniref:Uncharacterized protein n=1 Tax=Effrenium voratum TaxID=2562239 RepID=A0AA36MRC4_9DINO|nr:unnamed protein product [Effrenium voratum]